LLLADTTLWALVVKQWEKEEVKNMARDEEALEATEGFHIYRAVNKPIKREVNVFLIFNFPCIFCYVASSPY